jgi:hypothetical protein
MARIGKIARLPEPIRDQLNRRLRDGHLGPQILPWLNSLPETLAVLNEFFSGQPINAQNLSDWRQGGFAEWEEKQDSTFRVKELASYAVKLTEANGGSIAEGAAAIASGKLLELLESIDSRDTVDLDQISDVVTALSSLRSAEIAQQRVNTDRDKLKRKDEELRLAQAAFDQRLLEYHDKVATQKAAIEGALVQAKSGGITPETLAKIEEAARLL